MWSAEGQAENGRDNKNESIKGDRHTMTVLGWKKKNNPATLTSHAGIIYSARRAWSATGDFTIRERGVHRKAV